MNIKTRDFGDIQVDKENFINFKEPILGFDSKIYTIISFSDIGNDFVFLQSVDDSETCFVLVSPSILPYEYKPIINSSVKNSLDCDNENDVMIWLIGVICQDDIKKSTVNLKSPIFINTKNNSALQYVLDENYPLKSFIYSNDEFNEYEQDKKITKQG